MHSTESWLLLTLALVLALAAFLGVWGRLIIDAARRYTWAVTVLAAVAQIPVPVLMWLALSSQVPIVIEEVPERGEACSDGGARVELRSKGLALEPK